MKIDHVLARGLWRLPLALTQGGVPDRAQGAPGVIRRATTELARLNLHRGRALRLPGGEDVADAMGEKRLTEDELFEGLTLSDKTKDALLGAMPLWYYILREANAEPADGRRLGAVGGRIVAEVLAGLLASDPSSCLRQYPAWSPTLKPGDFTMLDLVEFAAPRSGDTPES